MIEILKEALRTVLFPSIVAIATLYAGTKLNNSKSEKLDKNEAEKQRSMFYLKLDELIKNLENYEEKSMRINTIMTEVTLITNGEIEYNSRDYNFIPESEFLNGLIEQRNEIVSINIPNITDQLKQSYGSLASCPIDKLNPKDSFGCLTIVSMGSVPQKLLENKEALEEAREYYKPIFI